MIRVARSRIWTATSRHPRSAVRSLEQDPEEDEVAVAAAWAAEIERRIDENAPGILAETVFAEGRMRLQKRS